MLPNDHFSPYIHTIKNFYSWIDYLIWFNVIVYHLNITIWFIWYNCIHFSRMPITYLHDQYNINCLFMLFFSEKNTAFNMQTTCNMMRALLCKEGIRRIQYAAWYIKYTNLVRINFWIRAWHPTYIDILEILLKSYILHL
jgi:hypothetical protein